MNLSIAARVLALAAVAQTAAAQPVLLRTETQVFEHVDGGQGDLLRIETEWFASDGRLLRRQVDGPDGQPILRFYLQYDEAGEQVGALYLEEEETWPNREVYSFSKDRKTRIVAYFGADRDSQGKVVETLDQRGEPVAKKFYRADGGQFGREEVRYDQSGRFLGWTFSRTDKESSVRFDFQYLAQNARGAWTRRVKGRDGQAYEVQVRRLEYASRVDQPGGELWLLGPGIVSSPHSSEESPSRADDGTLLFLRPESEEWPQSVRRRAFLARQEGAQWEVEEAGLPALAYTASLSRNGKSVFYSVRSPGSEKEIRSYRIDREESGWSAPADLTELYRIRGSYLSRADNGSLYYFSAEGDAGPGLYRAAREGDGYAAPRWMGEAFNPPGALSFAPFVAADESALLFSRFVEEDGEDPDGRSGIYVSHRRGEDWSPPRKVEGLPYGWSASISRGELTFTDGKDVFWIDVDDAGLRWPRFDDR